ncbi:MAG: hypothetical protein CVT81_02075 [Alphaproteobacteria bacterium HGW-Alphaproteobacteria-3]|nr:MAG: hypothetical protein CVT81_02075 [Alphaproteobacteria bacterium HGW-Alphaproteobacteria-3]
MHAILTAAIVLCAALLGLVMGTAFAAAFLVPESSGLAGPAEALGYGLLVAAVFAVASGILVWRLDTRAMAKVFLVFLGVTGAMGGALYLRYDQLSTMRAAEAEPAGKAGLALTAPVGE